MKKEVTTTQAARPAIPAKKVTHIKVLCDICGKGIDKSEDNRYGSGNSECHLCGRDICRRMTKSYGSYTCYKLDPIDDWKDYRDKYCIKCFDLKFGEKYDAEYRKVIDEKYSKLEALDEKVKVESLTQHTRYRADKS